jgi:protein-disulfide isomerase
MVVRNELRGFRANTPRALVETEKDWAEYALGGHSLGPLDAPVTIVEFSDFQCPFCRGFANFHDSLTKLGYPVRVVYRHSPGPGHQFAIAAARASVCAEAQGRFEQMHDALFAGQPSIGDSTWSSFARTAGVPDSAAFHACIESEAPVQALADDTLAGTRLNVRGTPTLLIHDLRVNGLPDFDSLLAYVRRAAAQTSEGVAP